jgi:hypothetical protein
MTPTALGAKSPMPRHAETRGDRLLLRLEAIIVGLRLDRRDLVIFGSAPLFAHGLCPDVHDLDVVARGAAWDVLQGKGENDTGTVNGAPMVSFWDGCIQFSRGWISPEWNTDALIDRADMIGGLPFAALRDVLAYKEQLRRDKDLTDISILRRELDGVRSTSTGVPRGPFR